LAARLNRSSIRWFPEPRAKNFGLLTNQSIGLYRKTIRPEQKEHDMSSFTYHTRETAPEGSKEWLPGGFVPNLHAIMAESPGLLAGYKTLWDLFGKTSLTPLEQQVVMMTANFENDCAYCVPWHSYLMAQAKMPQEVIDGLREGTPLPDAKLEALRVFARTLIEKRGHAGAAALEAFLAASYTRQQALEVVLGLAVKVMSNYTNAIADTKLDDPPRTYVWTKPQTAAVGE
jgi:alkylhydroperoxidase family enzyme